MSALFNQYSSSVNQCHGALNSSNLTSNLKSKRPAKFAIAKVLLLFAGLYGANQGAMAQSICVFDLGGASGDNYALMKDYVLAAKSWNVALDLKPYSNEGEALSDFKQGKCEGLLASSYMTREFNSYTGSINAIGAIPSNVIARNLLMLMGNFKVARDMIEGDYEAAGVIPIGSAYLTTRDRTINTLAKM